MNLLFTPIELGGLTVRNRLWVAPMCQYSAVDGVPNDWHHVHLAQFASGGAGVVIAEATAVLPEGRISPEDVGLWNDAQRDAWAPIAASIAARGAVPGIQLAHAGRKASTWSPLTGKRGTVPASDGGWQTVAPSAIAFEGFDEPVALDAAGIDAVVDAFAAAAVFGAGAVFAAAADAAAAADTDAFGAGSAEAAETDATGTAVVAGASPRTSSRSAGGCSSCTSVTSSPRTTSSSKSSSSSKAVGSVTSTCAVAPSTMPMPVVSVPSVVASTPLSAFSPSFSLRSGATFHTPDHSWTPCAPAPG